MSHATSMLSALNAAPIEVSEVSTPRANEVHCRVAAAAVKSLADFAWKQLASELILMLADGEQYADTARRMTRQIHQHHAALVGGERGLENERAVAIAPADTAMRIRRRDQPAAVPGIAEQGGEAGAGIEARPA